MAAVTSVGETPAPTAASRPRGMHARRRRRLNIFRYVVFTVFGLFFLLPLLAMLRFSLEGSQARHLVPDGLEADRLLPEHRHPSVAERDRGHPGTGRHHQRGHAGAAGADHDLDPAAGAVAGAHRGVPLHAAAHHPRDRAGGRRRPDLQPDPALQPVRADAVLDLRDPGAALRLPGAGRRAGRDRREDALRSRAQPGGELVHRDGPGDLAEHAAGHPERAAADLRAGPRRVHHRLPAAL